MTAEEPSEKATVPLPKREALLESIPAFALLPPEARRALAGLLREQQAAAGQAVVVEGEDGDRLFLIVSGRAEVSAKGAGGKTTILAMLGPGEQFGEQALLSKSGKRRATVTALTPLLLLTLSAKAFHALRQAYPATDAALAQTAETRETVKFLKQATPFAVLAGTTLQALLNGLERKSVPAGETILRQGEPGQSCFVVRSGLVEVSVHVDNGTKLGTERRLATLGPGTLFGETALLTDAPRSATIRALEATDLWELRRHVLLHVMGEESQISGEMLHLVQLRDRPRPAEGVEVHQRTTADGQTLTSLKDTARGVYHQLSPEGWYLWQRLDGNRTLRDLTVDGAKAFPSWTPQAIEDTLSALSAAGFLQTPGLSPEAQSMLKRPPLWQRALRGLRRSP